MQLHQKKIIPRYFLEHAGVISTKSVAGVVYVKTYKKSLVTDGEWKASPRLMSFGVFACREWYPWLIATPLIILKKNKWLYYEVIYSANVEIQLLSTSFSSIAFACETTTSESYIWFDLFILILILWRCFAYLTYLRRLLEDWGIMNFSRQEKKWILGSRTTTFDGNGSRN